jgi:hypothetical protein
MGNVWATLAMVEITATAQVATMVVVKDAFFMRGIEKQGVAALSKKK